MGLEKGREIRGEQRWRSQQLDLLLDLELGLILSCFGQHCVCTSPATIPPSGMGYVEKTSVGPIGGRQNNGFNLFLSVFKYI